MQFIWHVRPGPSALEIKRQNLNFLNGQYPESFEDGIMFMSMCDDIGGDKETSLHNATEVAACAIQLQPRLWLFLRPASENTWGTGHLNEPRGQWDIIALQMVDVFNGHTFASNISSDRAINYHIRGTYENKILINTIQAGNLLRIHNGICQ